MENPGSSVMFHSYSDSSILPKVACMLLQTFYTFDKGLCEGPDEYELKDTDAWQHVKYFTQLECIALWNKWASGTRMAATVL